MAAAAPSLTASSTSVEALASIFGDKGEASAVVVIDAIISCAAGPHVRTGTSEGASAAELDKLLKSDKQALQALAVMLCETAPGMASRDATQAFFQLFCCSFGGPAGVPLLDVAAGWKTFRALASGPRASLQGHVQPELVEAMMRIRNSGEARAFDCGEDAVANLVDNPSRYTVTMELRKSGWRLCLWHTNTEGPDVQVDAYVPAFSMLLPGGGDEGASPWQRVKVPAPAAELPLPAGTLVSVATGKITSAADLCAPESVPGDPMGPCIRPSLAQQACFQGNDDSTLLETLSKRPGNFAMREASDKSGLTAIYTTATQTLAKLRFPAFPDSARSNAFASEALRHPESMLNEPAAFLRSPELTFPSPTSQPYATLSRMLLGLQMDGLLKRAVAGGKLVDLSKECCATADELLSETDMDRWLALLRASRFAAPEPPAYGEPSLPRLGGRRASGASDSSEGSVVHGRPTDAPPAEGASGAGAAHVSSPATAQYTGSGAAGGRRPDQAGAAVDTTWAALGQGSLAARPSSAADVEAALLQKQLGEVLPSNYDEDGAEVQLAEDGPTLFSAESDTSDVVAGAVDLAAAPAFSAVRAYREDDSSGPLPRYPSGAPPRAAASSPLAASSADRQVCSADPFGVASPAAAAAAGGSGAAAAPELSSAPQASATLWMLESAKPLVANMDLHALKMLKDVLDARIAALQPVQVPPGCVKVFGSFSGNSPGAAELPPVSHLAQEPCASSPEQADEEPEFFPEECEDE